MAYRAVWDQDWTSLYRQVKCPMLLLCAEDDVLFLYVFPRPWSAVLKGANFEPDLDPGGTVKSIRQLLATLRD